MSFEDYKPDEGLEVQGSEMPESTVDAGNERRDPAIQGLEDATRYLMICREIKNINMSTMPSSDPAVAQEINQLVREQRELESKYPNKLENLRALA